MISPYLIHDFPTSNVGYPHKYCRLFLTNQIQFPRKCYHKVSPKLIHDFPTSNVGYPHSIPVKSNSLQILQWKSEYGDFQITGIVGTCNPHKFEIPALWFPYKPPVNPCKHLQCSVRCHGITVFSRKVSQTDFELRFCEKDAKCLQDH